VNRAQRKREGIPVNVPLLGQSVKTFICRAGHVYDSPSAWRLVAPGMMTGPMCPICFGNWITYLFPQWPAEMTIEEAVGRGLLNPAVLHLGEELEDAPVIVEFPPPRDEFKLEVTK